MWQAIVIVLLIVLIYRMCSCEKENLTVMPGAFPHVRASATSRPMPAMPALPVFPRMHPLRVPFSQYVEARGRVVVAKNTLTAAEVEINALNDVSQNNYTADVKDRLAVAKQVWLERQKILSHTIGMYNRAAANLRAAQIAADVVYVNF